MLLLLSHFSHFFLPLSLYHFVSFSPSLSIAVFLSPPLSLSLCFSPLSLSITRTFFRGALDVVELLLSQPGIHVDQPDKARITRTDLKNDFFFLLLHSIDICSVFFCSTSRGLLLWI